MKNSKRIISIVLLVSLLVTTLITTSGVSATEQTAQTTQNEKDYIVLTQDDDALEYVNELSDSTEDLLQSDGDNEVISKATLSPQDVQELKSTDGVVAVEKDITLKGSAVDSTEEDSDDVLDCLFKDVNTQDLNQWNLDAIGSTDETYQNKVKIELLDSGVNYSRDIDIKHRENLIPGENINPLYEDFSGHGTSMASVIGAKDNGTGVTGVNPNAEIYSVRVLDDNTEAPLSRIVEGIQWGIDNNMDIINMSFGTNTNSSILRTAIKEADEAGILLISATGNDNTKGVQYPASYPEVLAVGSMDENSQISDFTSVGEELDVIAPGEKIETTGIFGTINGTEGTSVATAQVSAVASKILEKDKSKTPDFVKKLIIASSKRVEDAEMVTGAVDLNYALEIYDDFAQNYTPNEDVQEYTNPQTPEEYDSEGFVKGLWFGGEHAEMAGIAAEDVIPSTTALNLVKKGAIIADKDETSKGNNTGFNFKEVKTFHGAGNYVASVKVAWYFVNMMLKYENIVTAENKTFQMMSNMPAYYNSDSNNENSQAFLLDDLLATLSLLDSINFSKFTYGSNNNDTLPTPSKESIRYVKYKAAGLCIHMVGDIFAHRTQVPPYYSSKFTNQDDFPIKESFTVTNTIKEKLIEDCQNNTIRLKYRYRQPLQNAVSYEVVEFRDIKRFSPKYYNGKVGDLCEKYEDNPNFYSKRNEEAYGACTCLYGLGLSNKFNIYVLAPTINDNGKNVKLCNFKSYNKSAGFSNEDMNTVDWDAITMYSKKVDANGNIVNK